MTQISNTLVHSFSFLLGSSRKDEMGREVLQIA